MREILFKAKRKDNGEWVEGYVVFCNGKINPGQAYIAPIVSSIIALEDWSGLRLGPFVEVDPETVCQYTGLTDKNGKKVFDGDEIIAKGSQVDWNYLDSWVVDFNDLDTISDLGMILEFEVIGNIHDEEE